MFGWMALLACAMAGYLIGSISFAIVVSKLFGLADPRSYGSQNPGATNVLRTGNKAAAVLTLLGDALKGAVAVWIVQAWGMQIGAGPSAAAAAGLAAFMGHLYPVYFRFIGGKGVATFFGVVLALNPWAALISGVAWLVLAVVFRYASLASIAAAAVAVLVQLIFWRAHAITLVFAVMALLLTWRHRENIARLRARTESKLGRRA